jgi:hypothetical protein
MATIDSDNLLYDLITHLQTATPLGKLSLPEARAVFARLSQLGYVIEIPKAHPSGIPTSEQPFTEIQTSAFRKIKINATKGK